MSIDYTTIKLGDRIKFRAATRWSNRAEWRRVNGFDPVGRPTVRFGGHAAFVVRPLEILEIAAQQKDQPQ